MSVKINEANKKDNFDKEKQYKFGTQIFVIKHEYSGSKRIGEVLTNMIIRNATAAVK